MKALIESSSRPTSPSCSAGPDVVAVTEREDLIGSSDRAVVVAGREGRAVVTNDVKDFRPLAAARLAHGGSRAGLILLPAGTDPQPRRVGPLADAIGQVLSEHPDGIRDSERWIGPLASS